MIPTDARWVRVVRDGVDTIHCNPGEECNLDDTRNDRAVTEDEALAAIEAGDARPCGQCMAAPKE